MSFITDIQGGKFAKSIVPQSINGTDTLGTAVDTLGYHYAMCVFHAGAIGAADFDELVLAGCETSGGTYVDISATQFTAPTQTSDDGFWIAYLDLRNNIPRFLKWHADPGAAASLMTGFIILYRADDVPTNDTDRGITQSKIA